MTSKQAPPCPECGKSASGNFCQHCGASLGGRFCNQCGEKVPAGSKFCNQCGAKVKGGDGSRAGGGAARAGGARRGPAAAGAVQARPDTAAHREAAASVVGGQNLPWWIAGGAMFILILVVGLNMVRPGPGPVPTPSGPASATTGAAPAGAVDLASMSPIEAADRLFNRVMQSISAGDSASAQGFMPMALAAYERARPLNLDGLFHLSMLNRTAMNLEAALLNAQEILDQDPNHLFGLVSAAEASLEMGELDQAAEYYRQLLEVYDAEVARGLEEYNAHSAIVNNLRGDAEAFLAGR